MRDGADCVSRRPWAASALAALTLGGCSDPAWRNPQAASTSTAPAPEVAAVLDADATAGKRAVHHDHVLGQPLTALPAWGAAVLGRNLREAFPRLGACIGNIDGVKARYLSGAGGTRVAGWGWDQDRQTPVGRVILVDKDFRIVGAGESGARRLDVPRALPAIGSDYTGWEAITPLNAGALDAYGVKADGQTLCKLGHLEL